MVNIGDFKIALIKELRSVTTLGLKEAKDAIEGAAQITRPQGWSISENKVSLLIEGVRVILVALALTDQLPPKMAQTVTSSLTESEVYCTCGWRLAPKLDLKAQKVVAYYRCENIVHGLELED